MADWDNPEVDFAIANEAYLVPHQQINFFESIAHSLVKAHAYEALHPVTSPVDQRVSSILYGSVAVSVRVDGERFSAETRRDKKLYQGEYETTTMNGLFDSTTREVVELNANRVTGTLRKEPQQSLSFELGADNNSMSALAVVHALRWVRRGVRKQGIRPTSRIAML